MEFIAKATGNWSKTRCDCLIVPVFNDTDLKSLSKELDTDTGLQVDKRVKHGDISSKKDSLVTIYPDNGPIKRLLFKGCGKAGDIGELRELLAGMFQTISKLPAAHVAIRCDLIQAIDVSSHQQLEQLAMLFTSESYRYDKTLSKKADKPTLKKVTALCPTADASSKNALARGQAIGNGMNTAKELGNLPANICTPAYLAKFAGNLGKNQPRLSIKVLDETQMKKLKMGSLLSVTAGTSQPAKTIIIEYKGGKPTQKPYALVGKGVTFDSGGISLKPGAKMDEMKYDMCGAASVFGTLQTVNELALPINVIGIIGAVENLPSGTATKPGDVITSMSGQTIEVLNTDAEGRLVLCDLLTYTERYKPQAVIDLATLTGACVVALGSHASALYSNHEPLSGQLLAAGNAMHDRAWPMPLWEDYNKQLKSNFADMANIGGPEGGSITAACFLSRFTQKYHWAHLDIAGAAWNGGGNKGATGRPVSLLSQYLIDRC